MTSVEAIRSYEPQQQKGSISRCSGNGIRDDDEASAMAESALFALAQQAKLKSTTAQETWKQFPFSNKKETTNKIELSSSHEHLVKPNIPIPPTNTTTNTTTPQKNHMQFEEYNTDQSSSSASPGMEHVHQQQQYYQDQDYQPNNKGDSSPQSQLHARLQAMSLQQQQNSQQQQQPQQLLAGGVSRTPPQRVRKLARPSKVARLCSECGTGDTPSWRRGADGARTLCNACGLQFIRRIKKEERLEIMKNWREGDPEPPRPRGRPLEHPIPPPPRKRKAPMPMQLIHNNGNNNASSSGSPMLSQELLASEQQQQQQQYNQQQQQHLWSQQQTNFAYFSASHQSTTQQPTAAPLEPSSLFVLPSLLASIPTRKSAKTSDDAKKPKSSVDFLLNSDDDELNV